MEEQAFAQRYTTQEKLLLAQAVYKLGATQWDGISKLLAEHPCIVNKDAREKDRLFSPAVCEEVYVGLMTGIGINVPAEGSTKAQAKPHLRLAQTFYIARMAELKLSISAYEQRFTTLMSEIQMVKSGEMDGAIASELRAILARKFGKRLLDAWVPEKGEVEVAVEKGQVSEEDLKSEQREKVEEKMEVEVEAEAEVEVEKGEEVILVEKPEEVKEKTKTPREKAAESRRKKAEEAEVAKKKKAEEAEMEETAAEVVKPDKEESEAIVADAKEANSTQQEEATPTEVMPTTDGRTGSPSTGTVPDVVVSTEREQSAKPTSRNARSKQVEHAEPVETELVPASPSPQPTRPTSGRRKKTDDPAEVKKSKGEEIEQSKAAEEEVPTGQPSGARPTRRNDSRTTRGTKTPAPEPVEEDVEMVDAAETEKPASPEASKPKVEVEPVRRIRNEVEVVIPVDAPSPVTSARPTRPDTRRTASKINTPAPKEPVASSSKPPVQPKPPSPSPPGSPLSELSDTDSAEPVPLAKSEKKAVPTKPARGRPSKKKQEVKEVEQDNEEDEKEEEEDEEQGEAPSTRASKRKATVPPTNVPPAKRKGRKESPAATIATVPDSDDEEVKPSGETEDQEDKPSMARRNSRRSMPAPPLTAASTSTRRGRPPKDSPAREKTRESSPAVSRRAPSVSSTTSATPASATTVPKRGPGRPPKNRKEETPIPSPREEEDKPTRVSARVRGVVADVDLTPMSTDRVSRKSVGADKGKKEKEEEEVKESRPKRGSIRIPPQERADASDASPSLSASPTKRSTPAIPDSGASTSARTSLGGSAKTPTQKMTAKMLYSLLDQVSAHKNGNIFQNPVRKSDAPDYFKIVKQPMDLKTVRQRIRDGHIANIDEFERDVKLIFVNAMMYNDKDTQIHGMAKEMMTDAESHIAHYRLMQQDMGKREAR